MATLSERTSRASSSRECRVGPAKKQPSDSRRAIVLLAPMLLILAVVIGYPVVAAIVTSLRSDPTLENGFFTDGGHFNGVGNYLHWLLQSCGGMSCPAGTLGSQFWDSVSVTGLFSVVTVALEVVLGVGMALIMNKAFRGRGLLRAAVLAPWAIPTAVTAKLWFFMFAYDGIVNRTLGTHILWTSDLWASRVAVIVGDVWKTTPFVALLILAGLQVIPGEVYEAARVDGTTAWQRFRLITLPLVKPALLVAVLFRLLDVLRMYDLPQILTGGGGGDGHATTTMSILVTQQINQGYGGASALSTLTFLLIFGVAFAFVKLFNTDMVRSQQKAVK